MTEWKLSLFLLVALMTYACGNPLPFLDDMRKLEEIPEPRTISRRDIPMLTTEVQNPQSTIELQPVHLLNVRDLIIHNGRVKEIDVQPL